jgi:nickel/cobalt exporter
MNRIVVLSAVVFALAQFCPLSAQENPFFSGTKPIARTESTSFGLFHELPACINDLQRNLNASLSELSRKVNEEHDIAVFMLLLAVAIGYGTVHALGPGHGKFIMITYALANPLKAGHGILLGVFIAIIHTLSAIVLVSLLYLMLNGTYADYAGGPKRIISLVCSGLIAVMGIVFLVGAFVSKRDSGDSSGESDHSKKRLKNLVLPAILMGIVPCEGAVLILVFSISIGAFWLGIILAAVMSVGMAITISATGFLAVYSRNGAAGFFAGNRSFVRIASLVFRFTGSAAIAVFGALLFFSNL